MLNREEPVNKEVAVVKHWGLLLACGPALPCQLLTLAFSLGFPEELAGKNYTPPIVRTGDSTHPTLIITLP